MTSSFLRDFSSNIPSLDGKSILVTGGTGSFGKAFIKRVLEQFKPKRLIVFSRDELKQYEMEQEFPQSQYECMRYFIGDVRDYNRLTMALREVDIVVHAAAMKHVSAAEYNPFECIHTNVIGAENIVRASIHCGVEKVIALSTDKAANPINLYGASKLASDKIFTAGNNMSSDTTRFCVVRYGNVLGSRGSVIPFFQKLIQNGTDHLPITDPRMTRFWITIDQGVSFVLSCLGSMVGAEIFVPKIPSMKITDLAECMGPGLEQRVIGIRPGEKIHEVLITADDGRSTYEFDDRYVIGPSFDCGSSGAYWASGDIAAQGGKLVEEGFSYHSDTSDEWLNLDDMKTLLNDWGFID